jgi:hypothetical protein
MDCLLDDVVDRILDFLGERFEFRIVILCPPPLLLLGLPSLLIRPLFIQFLTVSEAQRLRKKIQKPFSTTQQLRCGTLQQRPNISTAVVELWGQFSKWQKIFHLKIHCRNWRFYSPTCMITTSRYDSSFGHWTDIL